MQATDDRDLRELRRNHLARRMLRYGARNCVVSQWTALSERRIRRMKVRVVREMTQAQEALRRGPPPSNLAIFFRSAPLRSEAASVAVLFQFYRLLPGQRGPQGLQSLHSIARGEVLCAVWDMLPNVVSGPRLSFEHVALLAESLTLGTEVGMGCCSQCGAIIVVDLLRTGRRLCSGCRSRANHVEFAVPEEERLPYPRMAPPAVQGSLF